jgi:hypothetical protein
MSTKTDSSSGINLLGLVFIVFLFLKLGEIGPVQFWPWWWVTSPIWIPLAIAAPLVVVAGVLKGKIAQRREARFQDKLERIRKGGLPNPNISKFQQRMMESMARKVAEKK